MPAVRGTETAPQWSPPAHLADPYVKRADVVRAIWIRNLTKWGIPRPTQLVAHTLAAFGDTKGANCYPGMARLAEDLDVSVRTVERHLAWLLEHGWIKLVARGARKSGEANVYQLTIPAPVAAGMTVPGAGGRRWLWSAENGEQWEERPAGAPGTTNPKAKRSPAGRFLPDNRGSSTRQNVLVLPVRNDGTPGGDQVFTDHSELSLGATLPRGGARAHGWPHFEAEDDEDLAEQVGDYIAGEITDLGAYALAHSMVDRGYHPNAILNTARKQATW